MEESTKAKVVFLDASMLVAAVLSREGGSFRVVTEASVRGTLLITSRYAYQETKQALQEKYPQFLTELHRLSPLFAILPNPPEKTIRKVIEWIDYKDAPILAAAIRHKANVLITLDRKHFLENEILKEKIEHIEILTPGSFIQKYF